MSQQPGPAGSLGRRERAMADKRRRIMDAARALFAERGVGGVTTQEISDRADVASGTLFRYAATKAELLIMVQNEKFAAAIDAGLAAAAPGAVGTPPVDTLMALLDPVIHCVREQPENGRQYLHELTFGDPAEPHRAAGLAEAWRLESAVAGILGASAGTAPGDQGTLARVVTAVIHVTMTATLHLHDSEADVKRTIRAQVAAILPPPVDA